MKFDGESDAIEVEHFVAKRSIKYAGAFDGELLDLRPLLLAKTLEYVLRLSSADTFVLVPFVLFMTLDL